MKFLKISFCLTSVLLFSFSGYCATITGSPVLNFGTIMQSSPSSSITLDLSGNISSYSGIYNPHDASSSDVTKFVTDVSGIGAFEKITLRPQDATYTATNLSNCSVNITNVTSDITTEVILGRQGNLCSIQTQQNAYFSATLTLTGICEEGIYTGKIAVPYDSKKCNTSGLSCNTNNANCDSSAIKEVYINTQFTITEPLEVTEKQALNFGVIVSPNKNGVITLSYNGSLSKSDEFWTGSRGAIKAGKFVVSGLLNRQVYITLPQSATIYSGSDSMEVTNFTSNSPIILTHGEQLAATEDVSIGATLNIKARQPAGNYQGTYTITVSY